MSEGTDDSGGIQVRPAGSGAVVGPAPGGYRPWFRWRVYTSFILGVCAATMLLACLGFAAIVLGWIVFGMGLAAWLIGRKEVAEHPQAAGHGFIKWGLRTGMLSMILGPVSAIVWIIIVAVIGMRF